MEIQVDDVEEALKAATKMDEHYMPENITDNQISYLSGFLTGFLNERYQLKEEKLA